MRPLVAWTVEGAWNLLYVHGKIYAHVSQRCVLAPGIEEVSAKPISIEEGKSKAEVAVLDYLRNTVRQLELLIQERTNDPTAEAVCQEAERMVGATP